MATPPSSTKASSTVPARRARSAARSSSPSARSAAARAALTAGGTWSARSAAGVPARREYGNAWIFAKRQARASVERLLELGVGLAGEARR